MIDDDIIDYFKKRKTYIEQVVAERDAALARVAELEAENARLEHGVCAAHCAHHLPINDHWRENGPTW